MVFSKVFATLLATVLATAVNASPLASPEVVARQETFTGIATYYDPNGGTGACGTTLQNSDFIVALGEDTWNGGAYCGDTVTVNYNGASIQVTVKNLCPGCQGSDGIDLSEGAMAALDPNYINDGEITVTWSIST
ncbi:Non-catalytic module family EXPN protein [Mycena galericulata]|nr:Non-catalytic module family EXPN protein [Mycena galericulata]